jgi:hypothetical protein
VLVRTSFPLQFVDYFLNSERFSTGPGSRKRGQDLLTSSHSFIMHHTSAIARHATFDHPLLGIKKATGPLAATSGRRNVKRPHNIGHTGLPLRPSMGGGQ